MRELTDMLEDLKLQSDRAKKILNESINEQDYEQETRESKNKKGIPPAYRPKTAQKRIEFNPNIDTENEKYEYQQE